MNTDAHEALDELFRNDMFSESSRKAKLVAIVRAELPPRLYKPVIGDLFERPEGRFAVAEITETGWMKLVAFK